MHSAAAAPGYSYAVLRVVPRVHRDEFVNAGVILYSPERRFLRARVSLDRTRLRALWPDLDMGAVERHLQAWEDVAEGRSNGGPIAALSQRERFHWLTAPRSAMIQVSPVRTGISEDPAGALEMLAQEQVGDCLPWDG